jgi:hypothetical protein
VTLTQRHDMSMVIPTDTLVAHPRGSDTSARRGDLRPAGEPVHTIAAQGNHHAVVVLPVAGNTHENTPGNRARRADERPLDTVHGTLDRAIVVPPMGNVAPRPAATEPAPTQTTTTRAAVVSTDEAA